ncbi:hypothetical protein HOU02_gp065 [Caulobacter phage CcrBL9]|uniref:Uncharacterized protein n=1 Tax=Caulobacter phage CcrBL9 TaxID=2283270 RepID=A0A385EEF0_9CAUD|nr:hypothetical protein HOU02_gp065 [Caulobacter phage CcrBL9]AXQ69089.1 hypothetical protein CcrBL9_gp065c [Caulobacter phage CcrBL9]
MSDLRDFDITFNLISEDGERAVVYSRDWPPALALSIKAGEELAFAVKDESAEGEYVVRVVRVRKDVDNVDEYGDVTISHLTVTAHVIEHIKPRRYSGW